MPDFSAEPDAEGRDSKASVRRAFPVLSDMPVCGPTPCDAASGWALSCSKNISVHAMTLMSTSREANAIRGRCFMEGTGRTGRGGGFVQRSSRLIIRKQSAGREMGRRRDASSAADIAGGDSPLPAAGGYDFIPTRSFRAVSM